MGPAWRYLCSSALAGGSVEVCVPSCDGWGVNWGRYDCMMCVFLNMGLYVLCVQVFTYMFTEMWKVVSWFMYRGRVYMRVSIVVCHEGTFTCLGASGMCVSVLGCIWLCVGVCVCVPVWACVAIGGDECARPVSWAGGVSGAPAHWRRRAFSI